MPEHRRVRGREHAVEEPEEGSFPSGILEDALRAGRDAVVLARVEGAGTARADDERKPRGERRHREAPAHVVAENPDRRRAGAALPHVVRVVEETLHDRRVPEIRVAVVHVENRDVHEALLRQEARRRARSPARRRAPAPEEPRSGSREPPHGRPREPSPRSDLLLLERTRHEIAHGVRGRRLARENRRDHRGDRHLDARILRRARAGRATSRRPRPPRRQARPALRQATFRTRARARHAGSARDRPSR